MAFPPEALLSFGALILNGLAAVFVYRQKTSYFRQVRWCFLGFFSIATVIISIGIPTFLVPSIDVALLDARVGIFGSAIACFMIVAAAVILKRYSRTTSISEAISASLKERYFPMYYYIFMITALSVSSFVIFLQPVRVKLPFSGEVIYGTKQATWFSLFSLLFLFSVFIYPCLAFLSLSGKARDTSVRNSLRIMATCIALIGASFAIFRVAGGLLGYDFTVLTDLTIAIASNFIVYAFKKPRVLSMFFESVASLPSVHVGGGKHMDAFSKTLGLNHQQMTGRKVLLEFDPASNYEKAVQDFATEALANAEPIVVFTMRGSAIHSYLSEEKAVKFFCLTPQVSVPKEFSENEILLPSNDTPLMLDVFDKTLKAHPDGVINVVFDNLSDLVLSVGFEKTYRFMRYAVEMLASPKNTVLFLLNRSAHDPKVASSLRGLFSNHTFFGKEGMQSLKWSKAEITEV